MQEPRTVMETTTVQVPQYTQQTYTMAAPMSYGAPMAAPMSYGMPMGMGMPVSSYKSSAPPTDQGLAYQTTTDDAISA